VSLPVSENHVAELHVYDLKDEVTGKIVRRGLFLFGRIKSGTLPKWSEIYDWKIG